jgi:hypothetical protein
MGTTVQVDPPSTVRRDARAGGETIPRPDLGACRRSGPRFRLSAPIPFAPLPLSVGTSTSRQVRAPSELVKRRPVWLPNQYLPWGRL